MALIGLVLPSFPWRLIILSCLIHKLTVICVGRIQLIFLIWLALEGIENRKRWHLLRSMCLRVWCFGQRGSFLLHYVCCISQGWKTCDLDLCRPNQENWLGESTWSLRRPLFFIFFSQDCCFLLKMTFENFKNGSKY